ncbi:nucleotidyltransferase domain-containing protein [Streptacidiphilus jiangxiensis]|uniref:Nucleotidyltransferase domain-containing protein n=1 Tax=Streptacidiphilus jiangxiensis TaxID=235985 RepID=A0A1H7IUK0_STRJI|nr:nucleotidyltransferase domain-containing protein [Streptacidiphilus jiangxiensis]SEK66183.1 hypothetical protein SAMN05414137_10321 [Streptacidiphilus jiangxiensis]
MSAALDAAARLAVFPGGYALAYGSHATGTDRATSDLDLLYTGAAQLDGRQLDQLIGAVKELHSRHGLDLDEEVPYQAKLYATLGQAKQAAEGAGFTTVHGAPLTIRESWYLEGESFRLRLIFNALTSPHVFLAGNAAAYRRHTALADRTAARLATAIHGETAITIAEAASALLRAPDGRSGKDYLGYLHPAHLHSVLARGFADLTARGLYSGTEAGSFQPIR